MEESSVELQALELIDLAIRLGPEGEGLELADKDYEMEDLVALKDRLSTMRNAIDIVNRSLASYWWEFYPNKSYRSRYDFHWLGRTRKKRARNKAAFYEWLATKNTAQLARLVADYNIKVGGMSKDERSEYLDESELSMQASIQSKPL